MTGAYRRILLSMCLGIVVLSPIMGAAQEVVPREVYERVIRMHSVYFQLRETGALEKAYMLLTDGQKREVTQAQFSSHWGAVRARYGKLTHLNVTKVTWYRNPPNAAQGLYAAVDFRARFERLKHFCGLVVWSIDQGYKVKREEMTFLDVGAMRPKAGQDEGEALKLMPCHSRAVR